MESPPNTVDWPTKDPAEQPQRNSIVDDWIRQVVMPPAQQLPLAESETNANRWKLLPEPTADANTADWMASYLSTVVEQTQALLSDAGTSSNVSPPLSSIGGNSCCDGDDYNVSVEEDGVIGTLSTVQMPLASSTPDDETAATKVVDWRCPRTSSSGDRESFSSSCRYMPTDSDANDDDDDDDLSQMLNKINLFRPSSVESLFADLSQISSDEDDTTYSTGRPADPLKLATPAASPPMPLAKLQQSSPIPIEQPPMQSWSIWAPSRLRPKTHADLARAVDAAFPFAATDEVQPYKSDGRSLIPARANVVSTVIRRNGANYVEDVSRQLTRLSNSSDGMAAVSTALHMVKLNYGTRNRMSPGELLELNADDSTGTGYGEQLCERRPDAFARQPVAEPLAAQPDATMPPPGLRSRSVSSAPMAATAATATGGCTGKEFIEQLAEKLWRRAVDKQHAQQAISTSVDSGCGGDRSPIAPPPPPSQWQQQRPPPQHQLDVHNTLMSTKRPIVGRSSQRQLGDITNSWFGGGRQHIGADKSSSGTRNWSYGYNGSSAMSSTFSNNGNGSSGNNNNETRNVRAIDNNSSSASNKENNCSDLLMRPVFCEFCRNTNEPVSVYMSHRLHENNVTLCPKLATRCDQCGHVGHTADICFKAPKRTPRWSTKLVGTADGMLE